VKNRAANDTIEVVTMATEERNRWKEATAHLYGKFEDMFKPGLLDAIKAA
jgi:hypothetical protein